MIKPYTIILGSTGSVGQNALCVIREHNAKSKKPIKVIGLFNKNKKDEQEKLKNEFGADVAITCTDDGKKALKGMLSTLTKKYSASSITALNAISGFQGLEASILLAEYKIDTLLANKEAIVAGGDIYLNYSRENNTKIIPVDSEHSALYTLLKAHKDIEKAIITASGGPFRDRENLDAITPAEAARHPNWNMGAKISIDSATLANKVLEVIEAKYLFSLANDKIDVIINPTSTVHSMLLLKNGAIYSEMSYPDMKLPIAKAYGLRKRCFIPPLLLDGLNIQFKKPNCEKFKFLSLIPLLLSSHTNCIIFNAADEIAVDMFQKGIIKFTQIFDVVKYALDNKGFYCKAEKPQSFEDIFEIDNATRAFLSSAPAV